MSGKCTIWKGFVFINHNCPSDNLLLWRQKKKQAERWHHTKSRLMTNIARSSISGGSIHHLIVKTNDSLRKHINNEIYNDGWRQRCKLMEQMPGCGWPSFKQTPGWLLTDSPPSCCVDKSFKGAEVNHQPSQPLSVPVPPYCFTGCTFGMQWMQKQH